MEAKFFKLTTLFFALTGAVGGYVWDGYCDLSAELGLTQLLKLFLGEMATFSSKSLGSRSESSSLFCCCRGETPGTVAARPVAAAGRAIGTTPPRAKAGSRR